MPASHTSPICGSVIHTLPAAAGRLVLALLRIRKIPDFLPERHHPRSRKIPIKGFIQADDYSCGAIAGWTVLNALRSKANFRAFYASCAPLPDWGTSTAKLARALRRHGIRVSEQKDLTYDCIKTTIESGALILLSVDAGAECLHWITVYGVGWRPRRIYISGYCTPGFSKVVLPWSEFKADWKPRGQGLICTAKA